MGTGADEMKTDRVFVSHTSDMASFPAGRSFVRAALDAVGRAEMVPVDMRYFAARECQPADYCRRRVRDCDVFMVIVGFRYGSLVPGEMMSYTEFEFHEATVTGKPRLVFLLDEPVNLPPELVDADTRAVGELRKRLREAGLMVATFASADELELETFHALTQLKDNPELAPRQLPAAVDRSTATSVGRVTRNGLMPNQRAQLEAGTIGSGQVPVTSDQRPDPQDADVLPAVWNVPGRNVAFTGRDDLLERLRKRLRAGGATRVQALYGMGGIGKTSVTVEYAHRFATDYQSVWWVNAERPDLIGQQLSRWAVAARLVPADTDTPTALAALRVWARQNPGWLVVFDSAVSADSVRDWLLDGPGHVLVTSRNPGWGEVAQPVEVPLFSRMDSLAVLRAQARGVNDLDADLLADALGDLPLALTQAAALLAKTGMSAADYLNELQISATQILSEERSLRYPTSLAAAVRISVRSLAEEYPASALLLQVCSFLAAAPIPLPCFITGRDSLPGPLAQTLSSQLGLGRCVARINAAGLARVSERTLFMHRLVQAVIRDDLNEADREVAQAAAEAFIVAMAPSDARDPEFWPTWAILLPHLLAVEPGSTSAGLRSVACQAVWYLLEKGDASTAAALAVDCYEQWSERFGLDDPDTLAAATVLARVRRRLGAYDAARRLDADTHSRRLRLLGEEHCDTLLSAYNLAFDLYLLGEFDAARDIDENVLVHRRRTLGEDHPHTLRSANNLGLDLHGLGEFEAARRLHEDTLGRFRLVLGEDHPDTLYAANSLARDLNRLGHPGAACRLNIDTLARYQRVLGEDHPDTLISAGNLAAD